MFGRWGWRYEGGACDMTFEIKAGAALDAFQICDLLDIAQGSATDYPTTIED